jgi:hypothetical protein
MKTFSYESQDGLGLYIVVLVVLSLVVPWTVKGSQLRKVGSFYSFQFFVFNQFYWSFLIFPIVIHNRPTIHLRQLVLQQEYEAKNCKNKLTSTFIVH